MSGRAYPTLKFTRNRKPQCHSTLRSSISGAVSRPLIFDMLELRERSGPKPLCESLADDKLFWFIGM
jgi:hypothetical protein